jgi:predicted Rdx family selenoprotein
MPKYLIERRIPEAGRLSGAELHAIAVTSCGVLAEMGPAVQWVHSYVTDDTITCLYIAPDEASVREHARRGGFPADRVQRVRVLIDPATAEAA